MNRWIPRITDTDVINKSQKGLLKTAIDKLGRPIIINYFKDSTGIFAYETNDFIIVARSYIYGWIISIHKSLVESASKKNKKIAIFIADANKIYKIDPNIILKHNTPNVRGDEVFLNFDIKMVDKSEEDLQQEKKKWWIK